MFVHREQPVQRALGLSVLSPKADAVGTGHLLISFSFSLTVEVLAVLVSLINILF